MNYYQHHIGDFRSGSVHMTRAERWIYRDMIEVYYDTENPLPLDAQLICNMIGVRSEDERCIVEYLLRFKFRMADEGYRQNRCDGEIAAYHKKATTARDNGSSGGRPRKNNPAAPSGLTMGTQQEPTGNPEQTGLIANQEPVTNNHKPIKTKAATPSALPDWLPVDCWLAFVAMRKAIKKPLTPDAVPIAIRKLDKLRVTGNDPRAILDQSTLNSWQGLFEVKADGQARASPTRINRSTASMGSNAMEFDDPFAKRAPT